jgi:predicted choloylglycine hydrolase
MKQLIIISLLVSTTCLGQQTNRELRTVTFSGSGYELGLQHGKALKKEIGEIISAWKKNASSSLGKDADMVIKDFFAYAQFDEAIEKWTPELYAEVKGIAEGSGQQLNDVLVLNLLDEFWVYIVALQQNHHCSGAGIPARNGNPGYISQNMDLENYTDGFQVLMRLNRTDNRPEQLILTHPGLIALNGMNEQGIGVCVNTIMQLKAAAKGLPVAFVIRRIINTTDQEELLSFVQKVNHASGQNYLIGIRGEVFDFEASANKVVRYNPMNENGSVYHTNHPIANDDIKKGFEKHNPNLDEASKPTTSNSHLRLEAVKSRMTSSLTIGDDLMKEALRSRDHADNPVCRTNSENGRGFTFASIIMTFSDNPFIQILAGPPDESAYERVDFTANQ